MKVWSTPDQTSVRPINAPRATNGRNTDLRIIHVNLTIGGFGFKVLDVSRAHRSRIRSMEDQML